MKQAHRRISSGLIVMLLAFLTSGAITAAEAQTIAAVRKPRKIDFALSFAADRTNGVSYPNQWLTGGSAELGADAWRGFGIAAKVTGLTSSSIGQGVPLNLVLTTFGPRYRLSHLTRNDRWISAYGEGLVGIGGGFKSVFAGSTGTTDSSNALAVQVGGGFDYSLTSRLGVRLVDAYWTRTQFPNGSTNVQNHVQLETGILLRF